MIGGYYILKLDIFFRIIWNSLPLKPWGVILWWRILRIEAKYYIGTCEASCSYVGTIGAKIMVVDNTDHSFRGYLLTLTLLYKWIKDKLYLHRVFPPPHICLFSDFWKMKCSIELWLYLLFFTGRKGLLSFFMQPPLCKRRDGDGVIFLRTIYLTAIWKICGQRICPFTASFSRSASLLIDQRTWYFLEFWITHKWQQIISSLK